MFGLECALSSRNYQKWNYFIRLLVHIITGCTYSSYQTCSWDDQGAGLFIPSFSE